MKVRNLLSDNGNKVANQFEIVHDGHTYFQSYNSMIARYDGKVLTLGRDWDYSVTTLKYLYIWLRENCWSVWYNLPTGKSRRDAIQKAIDNGTIRYEGGLY